MKSSLFYKFFPTPKYLKMPAAGLDISDQSIKFVLLDDSRTGLSVKSFGEVPVPIGIVDRGKIVKQEELAGLLKKTALEKFFHQVAVSLPEEEAYVVRLCLPAMPRRDLHEAIELQLEEYIPQPVAEAVFDYEIFDEPKDGIGNYDLSVSVFPKAILTPYDKALKLAGLQPLAYEIEVDSISRALVGRGDDRVYLVVDIGKTRTGFLIVERGVVLFSSTVANVGGDAVTEAIRKNLGVDTAEAERIKETRGLSRAPENANVFQALLPVVATLKDELNRTRLYWQSHKDKIDGKGEFAGVILCGGQATLPGLIEYISVNLKLSTTLGNPWINVLNLSSAIPPIAFNESLKYTTAIGLALRNYL